MAHGRILALCIVSAMVAGASSAAGQEKAQTPQSVPLGAGRPDTPGITRTSLKDDAKVGVTRVHFAIDAKEVPHTHPYDIIIIPLEAARVLLAIGDTKITELKQGGAQFVSKGVVHSLANTSGRTLDIVTVAVK
jgi:quercetin dioxygenase-like cupin family protein